MTITKLDPVIEQLLLQRSTYLLQAASMPKLSDGAWLGNNTHQPTKQPSSSFLPLVMIASLGLVVGCIKAIEYREQKQEAHKHNQRLVSELISTTVEGFRQSRNAIQKAN